MNLRAAGDESDPCYRSIMRCAPSEYQWRLTAMSEAASEIC
jgi:hypothetical protein